MEAVLGRSGDARFAPRRAPISAREWAKAVGLRVADRTRPISLERGVLVVHAASATWATELSMLREPILSRLHALGYEVTDVRFRVKPLPAPPRPAERRKTRAVPAPAPLPDEVARAVANVPDPELAAIIAEAAGRNLAWQDNARTSVSAARPAAPAPRAAGTKSAPPGHSPIRPRASRRRTREDE